MDSVEFVTYITGVPPPILLPKKHPQPISFSYTTHVCQGDSSLCFFCPKPFFLANKEKIVFKL